MERKEKPTGDDAEASKEKPRRKPLPDHLKRNETVLSPGSNCARCGGALKTVGEDVTEELEYVPGRFVVNRIVRPRMACAECERFSQAPLPSRPIERGRPGPGLLAHVLVSKFADHLPLYRQSQIYGRQRIDFRGSSLIARQWRSGSGDRQDCWSRSPTRSADMFDGDKRYSPMIRR